MAAAGWHAAHGCPQPGSARVRRHPVHSNGPDVGRMRASHHDETTTTERAVRRCFFTYRPPQRAPWHSKEISKMHQTSDTGLQNKTRKLHVKSFAKAASWPLKCFEVTKEPSYEPKFLINRLTNWLLTFEKATRY